MIIIQARFILEIKTLWILSLQISRNDSPDFDFLSKIGGNRTISLDLTDWGQVDPARTGKSWYCKGKNE